MGEGCVFLGLDGSFLRGGGSGFSGDGLAPQLDIAAFSFSVFPFLLGVSLALIWFRASYACELLELGVPPSILPGTSSDPSWA